MANYNFKVDLKGIIRLLSDNLYSTKDVFLRELLQNAVDAIRARKKEEPEFKDGVIKVHYEIQEDKSVILIFEDNGIGLNKEEIHSFLSVIGQSSKWGEEIRSSFIGQFGIGLLSCFLVAEEIKIKSHSCKEDISYQWIGHSNGTYSVTQLKEEFPIGTAIYLHLRADMAQEYGEKKIIEKLDEYGFLIIPPIIFEGQKERKQINDAFIPWRQQFCTKDEIMEFGEQVFEEEFLDVIPLKGEGIRGYAYICERQLNAATANEHKIFLKNMFITEDGKELIPKWAFFTKCILNCDDLTPTASRENFSRDYKLMKTKNIIEKCIFDYFSTLAKLDVRKLKQITMIHNVAIKSLAIENEKIYKLFFPFLTFYTNKGNLTGFQILEAAKKISVHYCVEIDSYRRISPLVENGTGLLINAGYIYDTKLLQMMNDYYKGIEIKVFDESSYEHLLETPSSKVLIEMSILLETAKKALDSYKCSVSLKTYSPKQLSVLYVPADDAFLETTFDANEYSEFLENFSFVEETEYSAKLYLNSDNSLIQRLAAVTDMEMLTTIIQVLYVQALLSGHYPLGEKEMELLNKNLEKLIEYGLE